MNKIKSVLQLFVIYLITIGTIIGIRLLHGMSANLNYYAVVSIVILCLIIGFSMLRLKHVDKLLSKYPKIRVLVVMTMNFLPIAKKKINSVMDNQYMRGIKPKSKSPKKYLSFLIPSVISAMIWADNATESIRMRGGE